jgi:hypothetical protein
MAVKVPIRTPLRILTMFPMTCGVRVWSGGGLSRIWMGGADRADTATAVTTLEADAIQEPVAAQTMAAIATAVRAVGRRSWITSVARGARRRGIRVATRG